MAIIIFLYTGGVGLAPPLYISLSTLIFTLGHRLSRGGGSNGSLQLYREMTLPYVPKKITTGSLISYGERHTLNVLECWYSFSFFHVCPFQQYRSPRQTNGVPPEKKGRSFISSLTRHSNSPGASWAVNHPRQLQQGKEASKGQSSSTQEGPGIDTGAYSAVRKTRHSLISHHIRWPARFPHVALLMV